MSNRRRLLVASAATAIPLGAWWAFGGRRRGDGVATAPATDPTPGAPPPPSESTITAPTSASTAPTTATPEVPPLDHNLVVGNVDPKVGIRQQRLTDLAFDPGPADDYFGEATVLDRGPHIDDLARRQHPGSRRSVRLNGPTHPLRRTRRPPRTDDGANS